MLFKLFRFNSNQLVNSSSWSILPSSSIIFIMLIKCNCTRQLARCGNINIHILYVYMYNKGHTYLHNICNIVYVSILHTCICSDSDLLQSEPFYYYILVHYLN